MLNFAGCLHLLEIEKPPIRVWAHVTHLLIPSSQLQEFPTYSWESHPSAFTPSNPQASLIPWKPTVTIEIKTWKTEKQNNCTQEWTMWETIVEMHVYVRAQYCKICRGLWQMRPKGSLFLSVFEAWLPLESDVLGMESATLAGCWRSPARGHWVNRMLNDSGSPYTCAYCKVTYVFHCRFQEPGWSPQTTCCTDHIHSMFVPQWFICA